MASVLWEIIIPLLVAFGVGLVIGWLLWRWRRTKVTATEWQRLTSSADGAEQRAARLSSERDGLSARVEQLTSDLEESESAKGRLRAELDAADGRIGLVSSEHTGSVARLSELEQQLDAAAKRAEGLEAGQREARARTAEREGEMAEMRARAKRTAGELDGLRERAALADRLEAEADSVRSLAKRLDSDLGDARRGASLVEGDLLNARARIAELEALVASGPVTSTAPVGVADTVGASVEHAEPDAAEPTWIAPASTDNGEPDNLQLIDGVGPKLEQFLHREGITTFAQLAALEQSDIATLQEKLSEFPGRIEREEWVPQARGIVSGTTSVRVVAKSERDDLKRIKGVGPVLERWLHGRGIYRFSDLTELDASAVAVLSSKLEDFPGRVEREEWIRQASELAAEGRASK